MPGPEKRLPGQSNADHGKKKDPNAEFLGQNSLYGGGDPSLGLRLFRALFNRRDRRRGRG